MSKPDELTPYLKLRRVNLLVTNHCNLRCRMCDFPDFYPGLQDMPLGRLKQLIGEVNSLGAQVLEISGGEAMMRPDIFEIIAFARSLGLKVSMVSNGTLIGPGEAERLINAGISYISISMEGPEPVHDHVRGLGNYQKSLNTLKNLVYFGAGQPDLVGVGITLSKYNYKLILPFSQYLLDEIGVNIISINPFLNDMLIEENRISRDQEFKITSDLIPDLFYEIKKLIQYAKTTGHKMPSPAFLERIPDFFTGRKLVPPGGCHLPEIFCGISTDGSIYSCWKNPAIGNLRDMSLTQILNSTRHRGFRDQALAGKCGGCLTACFAEVYQ